MGIMKKGPAVTVLHNYDVLLEIVTYEVSWRLIDQLFCFEGILSSLKI
jgi:hypothetical protein